MATEVDLMNEDFSRKSGEKILIFMNGASTRPSPLQVRLFGKLYKYDSVYDPETKRVRKPQDGEKAKTQFASHGVQADGSVKVFVFGKQIAERIKDIWDAVESRCPVEVLSSGTGMSTDYTVKKVKGNYPDVAEDFKQIDISALIDAVLGVRKDPETAPQSSETHGIKVEKKDLDWVNA